MLKNLNNNQVIMEKKDKVFKNLFYVKFLGVLMKKGKKNKSQENFRYCFAKSF